MDHKKFEIQKRIEAIEGLSVKRDLSNLSNLSALSQELLEIFKKGLHKVRPTKTLEIGNSMVMVDDREGRD